VALVVIQYSQENPHVVTVVLRFQSDFLHRRRVSVINRY